MRRTAAFAPLAVAAGLALGGCGSSSADYKNDPRPPGPIVLTGYIDDQRVSVSPRSMGAGPISPHRHQSDGHGAARHARERRPDGLGPRPQAGHGADQPAGHRHAEGRRQAGALHGPRRGRRASGPRGCRSAPSARARRTTCCSRRPPAAASDTIGPCRYAHLLRCCASASCSAPVPSRRRPPPHRAPRSSSATSCSRTPSTTSGVKRLLRTNAGFVSPTPVFADLTGDGKSDAVVTVENGGAAGAVAAYVLTAEGSDSGALRVAFRSQSLYRGRVRMSGPTVTVVLPDLRARRRRLLPAPRDRARLRVGRDRRRPSRGARRGR